MRAIRLSFVLVATGSLVPAALAQAPVLRELHLPLPRDTHSSVDTVLHDVDGNGTQDVLFAGDGVLLYLSDGAGHFADVSADLPAAANARSVALGDFDGDGDSDAMLGVGLSGAASSKNLVWFGDGSGAFVDKTATHLPLGLGDTRRTLIGDLDLDGDLDAIFANFINPFPTLQANELFLNNGNGLFWQQFDKLPFGGPQGCGADDAELFDVDADGDLDLLLAWIEPHLLLNDGTSMYAEAPSFPVVQDSSRVAVADVDGDGDSDALLWASAGANVHYSLLENNGAGGFGLTPAALAGDLTSMRDMLFHDFDGDGDEDLVTVSQASDLFLNDGAGSFVASGALPVGFGLNASGGLSDVEGDGDVDILFGNVTWQNSLLLNDGTAQFHLPPTNLPPVADAFMTALVLRDVDGDHDPDLLVGRDGPDELYLNAGDGFFTKAVSALPVQDQKTYGIDAADVDGDGDLDAALAGWPSARLWLNDGTGAFTDESASWLPAGFYSGTRDVEFADFDGDADPDLMFANSTGGSPASQWASNMLFLNQGGVFSDSTLASIPGGVPINWISVSLAVGDVDADGDLDALVGNGNDQQNLLYLNLGDGTFADGTGQLPAVGDKGNSVRLGDLDGDGDLDAVTVGPGVARVDLNNGVGVFTTAPGSLPPSAQAVAQTGRSVALGDLDRDRDLDLFVARDDNSGFPNSLYLNDGSGVFIEGPLDSVSDRTVDVGFADLDRDGDVDVFVGNFTSAKASAQVHRLLTNVTRQIAWRRVPSVDQPYTIEVYGRPGEAWVLAWSLNRVQLELPPFGWLQLDPFGVNLVGAGFLDSEGSASLTFAKPSKPVWIGNSLYWQALVGSDLKLTNYEATTFTTL